MASKMMVPFTPSIGRSGRRSSRRRRRRRVRRARRVRRSTDDHHEALEQVARRNGEIHE